jgi:type I restriction enzyme M protein
MEHKLQLRRIGGDEFKAESEQLLLQAEARLYTLDDKKKEEKKEITELHPVRLTPA